MAANTAPIFSRKPSAAIGANSITAANTAKDGTGTVTTVFTADATNGSFAQRLIIRPQGTNVATVIRVFLNNGATNATATNNGMIAERTLPASTLSEVSELVGFEIPLNLPMAAGYKLNVTLGTAVAGGYTVVPVAGDY